MTNNLLFLLPNLFLSFPFKELIDSQLITCFLKGLTLILIQDKT